MAQHRPLKVAHLTSAHPALDGRIFEKECVSLAAAGWDVSIIAPAEKDECISGVKIVAIPRQTGRLRRMVVSPLNIFAKVLSHNIRICHFHDPELIPIGMLLRLAGRKVIYDVHEDMPVRIMSKYWIPPLLRRFVSSITSAVEWTMATFASGIVAATPTIGARFPQHKTAVVQNFPANGDTYPEARTPYDQRPANAVYVGIVEEVRGARQIVAAIGQCSAEGTTLTIAGKFSPDSLLDVCKAIQGWDRVRFLGWRSRAEITETLLEARLGLVTLHPIPAYVDAYPVKLFEYMQAGLPVIASDFPLWREIVSGADCGLLVDPMKSEEIAKAIAWLIDHPEEARRMGENGKRAIAERYSWQSQAHKLLAMYDRMKR